MQLMERGATPLPPAILPCSLFIICVASCLSTLIGCNGSGPSITPTRDFSISVSPDPIMANGGSATFLVSTTSQNGFADSVTVGISGLPAGTTTSPAFPFRMSMSESQNVTLFVPASPGSFPLSVTGTSGSLTHSSQMTLTIKAAQDFDIRVSPAAITAVPGSSTSLTVEADGLSGFNSSVNVVISGLPSGAQPSPASPFSLGVGSSQKVSLSIPTTVTEGTYSVIVNGTSGQLAHSAVLALTVPTQDFGITLSPTAITANAGTSSAIFTAAITAENGFNSSVSVTLSGLPEGATTSPNSPFVVSTGNNQTVTLSVPTTAASGDYNVSATAASGSLTHSALLNLTVFGQASVTTWHYDNARTGANLSETTLTPSNVNSNTFGKLATFPVDGIVVGHPLYLPALDIPGQGVHNVVYVATMHDSVYAFDADNADPNPLWMTSLLNFSPPGATPVPASVKKETGIGWTEVGVISTPVIDPATGTLYLVAETYESGNVAHRLHALNVTTGQEKLGGPATIAATYTLNGITTTFADLYQINRPGLLLVNGHIYIAFGSNCCNDYSQGWVLSYNANTLGQEGAWTAEPGKTLASIWQKGAGISADSDGNVYAETGEGFYAEGTNLSISVVKLSQSVTTLALADWFTPYNRQFLSDMDRDLNDTPLILPDQPDPYPHELIAEGKEGTIYVLNRDNMGQFCSTCSASDTQIVQEIPQGAGKSSGSPVYWNNRVYFTGVASPVQAYTISNGTLVVPPLLQPIQISGGGHAILTANGSSNGILWFLNGKSLWALDAITLNTLYTSDQAANGRDTVPPLAHFATPIAADGKVFIGTQNSLVVYGPVSSLPGSTTHHLSARPQTHSRVERSPLLPD
jgi:hypothetical protein